MSYDAALATFLSGAGTNRLVMRGFAVALDTSALSQRGYIIQSLFGLSDVLQSGTPLTLLPQATASRWARAWWRRSTGPSDTTA